MNRSTVTKYGPTKPRSPQVYLYGPTEPEEPRPGGGTSTALADLIQRAATENDLKKIIDAYLMFLAETEELACSGTLDMQEAKSLIADLRSNLKLLEARLKVAKRIKKTKKKKQSPTLIVYAVMTPRNK